MALMAATGPPPNFLMPLVTGFPLLAGLTALPRDAAPVPRGAALGLGLVCGLAAWNSSLAIPAFAGMAAGLALAGLRPRLTASLAFTFGLALGVVPLLVARAIGASGARVVTASSAVTAVRPRWLWGQGLLDLAQALRGLAGLQVPLVVDGKERAALPVVLTFLLATGLVVAVAAGCRSRRVLPLAGWAVALAGAFWLSRRTGPDDLRYLYGVYAPALAVAGAGLASLWAWRRTAAAAAGLALLLPWGFANGSWRAGWPERSVKSDTRLMLVNALYFKGAWAFPFNPSATESAPFRMLDGSERTVSMMERRMAVPYLKDEGFQAFALPYVGNATQMLIILPDTGRFDEVEARLSASFLGTVHEEMKNTDFFFRMPKFQVETEIDLPEAMGALGMTDAFSNRANLSGITTAEQLFLAVARHKAFVAVDEKGTEAAAATAIGAEPVSLPPTFTVDRPFLFLIEDTETKTVLFIGRMMKP